MASESRDYYPITPTAFQNIRADLAADGVGLPDVVAGNIDAGHGFDVAWDYRPIEQREGVIPTLRITLSWGWLASAFKNTAWEKLEARIKKYVG